MLKNVDQSMMTTTTTSSDVTDNSYSVEMLRPGVTHEMKTVIPSTVDINESVSKMRRQLENVINGMASSRHTSDADNEESSMSRHSSTSIVSSVLKIRKISFDRKRGWTPSSVNRRKDNRRHINNKPVEECPFHADKNRDETHLIDQFDVPKQAGDGHYCSDLYRIEMENSKNNFSPPKRFIFDLVEEIPVRTDKSVQYEEKTTKGNVVKALKDTESRERLLSGGDAGGDGKKSRKAKKHTKSRKKIDVYYFDHGNSAYYRTTDPAPIVTSDELAERTERATTKFWAEIFGTLHIGSAFVTTFLLQLLRFLLHSVVRPLTIGITQHVSDYFLKPFLTVLFNGVVQPLLILFYNVASSWRDLCKPLAQSFGFFLHELAQLLGAIRLVEIRRGGPRVQDAIQI